MTTSKEEVMRMAEEAGFHAWMNGTGQTTIRPVQLGQNLSIELTKLIELAKAEGEIIAAAREQDLIDQQNAILSQYGEFLCDQKAREIEIVKATLEAAYQAISGDIHQDEAQENLKTIDPAAVLSGMSKQSEGENDE